MKTQTKKIEYPEKLQWHSLEDIVGEKRKSPTFAKAYNEELLRLRLAQQIRAARNAKKFTQKTVAERSGMPQSVIARIESGDKGITIDTLGKIAHALGKELRLI